MACCAGRRGVLGKLERLLPTSRAERNTALIWQYVPPQTAFPLAKGLGCFIHSFKQIVYFADLTV